MNLDQARLQLLSAPTTPLWTGTVASYNAETFCVIVSTVSGSYPTDIENLLIVHRGVYIARIKSRDGDDLYLAETPTQFIATFPVAIYDARLPWPRYQYIDEGVVYKDRDIAFPTPWQREMPPTAILKARLSGNDWGEAVYCAIGDTIYLDASDSYANLDDGAPLTYAWTPGTDGTITGSGATVTCAYTTNGFRYLKLVVTDAHGTTLSRYLPVWVGDSYAVSTIDSARVRWSVSGGWTGDLEMQSATTLLQYGPALLVDLETKNALFFGFVVPQSRATTFETTTQSLTLQSALAFSKYVHAYPFLVTAVTGAAEPSEWAEMYDPTLARALWYLIYWHSTLPEVVNCDISAAPVREIAGQEFTLGSVPQQVDAVLKSAFWQARGSRAGGFVVNVDPLYLDSADFLLLSGVDLTDPSDVRGALQLEYGVPQYSQARLGGVYRAAGGTFEPALVQSPSVPCPWGAPTEVNGLAPEGYAEMAQWAIRFMTVENNSDTYSLEPGAAVDPAATTVADLPDADNTRISIEQAEFGSDAQALRWTHGITGRSFGNAIGSAVSVPLPPDIVYPPPVLPPILPPIWPPLPEYVPDWPLEVYVATQYGGIYYTDDFSGPDSITQPTWTDISAGLPVHTDSKIYTSRFFVDSLTPSTYQYAHIVQGTTNAIYRRVSGGSWALSITLEDVLDLFGLTSPSGWATMKMSVNRTTGVLFIACTDGNVGIASRIATSSDYGANWSAIGSTGFNGFYGLRYPYITIGDVHIMSAPFGSSSAIIRSTDGGANWVIYSQESQNVDVLLGVSNALTTRPYVKYPGSTGVHIADASVMTPAIVPVSDVPTDLQLYGSSVVPYGFGGMWCSPNNPSWQWVLRRKLAADEEMQLYETTDAWTSAVLIGEVVADTDHKFASLTKVVEAEDYKYIMLGYRTPTASAPVQPHSVFAWDPDGDEYNDPVGKSGDSPGTSPYTDSIPYDAGGVIDEGIKYVPRT